MKNRISIIILALFVYVTKVGISQEITVPLRFDKYYTYDEIVQVVKALNKTYPELTEAVLVGKSEENREIWALEINNKKTGSKFSKPGVYVDGNIHGNEIQASEVVLYFADYLLKNYHTNPDVKKLVDRNAYYLIPSVNVDGRYHFFNSANTASTNRGLRRPKDDDRDGLFDEDFPDDLDGDGNICQMRKKDPFGKWKLDTEDPRIMVRVKDGEKGEYTLLGSEGVDNDGDGQINEDSEGYVDGNRNWGFNWQPAYVQSGSGDYPFSGTGIKAIANYMNDRPNIIVVYAFHNYGGMILRVPGSKELSPLNPNDIKVFDDLGKNAVKIIPGYDYLISWKDLYTTYGDFTDFTFGVFGAYSFVGELFKNEQETYSDNKKKEVSKDDNFMFGERIERQRERLKFNDNVVHGSLFKEWESFNHPVYGEIEIGGWVKMSSRLPHTFMLQDLVHRNASAVMYAASQTPDINMEIFDVTKLDNNLYQVRLRLYNKNIIPSMSYYALSKNLYPKDFLEVSGKNIKVLSGGVLQNVYTNQVNYKDKKPEIQFLTVPGNDKVEFQFLIEGKGDVQFRYNSQKAGNIKLSESLK
jgi:hypothetical protein